MAEVTEQTYLVFACPVHGQVYVQEGDRLICQRYIDLDGRRCNQRIEAIHTIPVPSKEDGAK